MSVLVPYTQSLFEDMDSDNYLNIFLVLIVLNRVGKDNRELTRTTSVLVPVVGSNVAAIDVKTCKYAQKGLYVYRGVSYANTDCQSIFSATYKYLSITYITAHTHE